jgi:RNA polymerase sigma-70 factor, ECF subfamily
MAEGSVTVQRAPETPELEAFRPLLFSIAYRMLGEVGDAEDVVQEAFLRAHRAIREGTKIRDPRAFLTEVATRLAIDHLRSARVRRERYVGPWLPEPLVGDLEPDVAERTELRESVSMAFLVVLERLSPVERAVFLLHDVFGYGFDEIARIVERSPENCRQIAVRARRRVDDARPRFEPSVQERDRLADQFFAAATNGDVDSLVRALAEDAVMVGDGNGQGALREPAVGALRVARLLAGLFRVGARRGFRAERGTVNAQPGLVVYDASGAVASVLTVDVAEGGRVSAVRSVVNPDKLARVQTARSDSVGRS